MSDLSREIEFWGDCSNTFHEEEKQLIYASRMGLYASKHGAHPPTFDIGGRSIIDIGGGPVSLLLKCVNRSKCAVVDPIIPELPSWVFHRYFNSGIDVMSIRAEALPHDLSFDEAWIYNVLQHVDDPGCVIRNALIVAKTVRIFEWIDIPAYEGHPNELRRDDLNRWFNGFGYVHQVNESGAVGTAYYGVFPRRGVEE